MDFNESLFQQEVKKFRRLLKTQSRHITFNGVHDLRVSTRRVRTQVRLIEKSTAHFLLTRAEKSLKKLSDALGERRQWDVTLKEAHKFHLTEKSLKKKQKQAGDGLQKLLRSSEMKTLLVDLETFEKSLHDEKILVQKTQLKKMRKSMRAWLKQKKFSPKDLHALRISTKKIRYGFECMGLPTEDLKDLQDHLGKSHDLTVLSEYFDQPKKVKKADQKERKRAQKRVRPALRSSLEVLKLLR